MTGRDIGPLKQDEATKPCRDLFCYRVAAALFSVTSKTRFVLLW